MLQQMGWKRGEGLGKDASGIVDPIAAEQYAQGVGLGAAHAKRSASPAIGDTYKERVRETVSKKKDAWNYLHIRSRWGKKRRRKKEKEVVVEEDMVYIYTLMVGIKTHGAYCHYINYSC